MYSPINKINFSRDRSLLIRIRSTSTKRDSKLRTAVARHSTLSLLRVARIWFISDSPKDPFDYRTVSELISEPRTSISRCLTISYKIIIINDIK